MKMGNIDDRGKMMFKRATSEEWRLTCVLADQDG